MHDDDDIGELGKFVTSMPIDNDKNWTLNKMQTF